MNAKYPERIVCLSTETTEVLYLLEEQDRIVGISGYTVRPSQARREKPKISAFTSAKIDKILDLKPDLVLGFSDLQAPIALDLIKRGGGGAYFQPAIGSGYSWHDIELGFSGRGSPKSSEPYSNADREH
jgi:hypothetical protein